MWNRVRVLYCRTAVVAFPCLSVCLFSGWLFGWLLAFRWLPVVSGWPWSSGSADVQYIQYLEPPWVENYIYLHTHKTCTLFFSDARTKYYDDFYWKSFDDRDSQIRACSTIDHLALTHLHEFRQEDYHWELLANDSAQFKLMMFSFSISGWNGWHSSSHPLLHQPPGPSSEPSSS
jgi:hypothetical protein